MNEITIFHSSSISKWNQGAIKGVKYSFHCKKGIEISQTVKELGFIDELFGKNTTIRRQKR
jgi:hypothetical protein